MTPVTNRLFVASVSLAACGLLLTSCGAGQVSQTADQQAAVNGASTDVKKIAVRNVHLEAVQTRDYLDPGRIIELNFVAINTSADVDDTLLSISSDIGTVTVTGDTSIPAGRSLIVGAPDGQDEFGSTPGQPPTLAEVVLHQPIANGLTYNFSFDFDQAGQITIAVPVSAGNAARQDNHDY